MAAPPVPNRQAPLAICGVDPDSGDVYSIGLANITAISTVGTTTVEAGQGVFYGFTVINVGTSFAANAYDILAGTSTTTLQVLPGGTSVGAFGPGPGNQGVRYANSLVVITTGTAGLINTLWD